MKRRKLIALLGVPAACLTLFMLFSPRANYIFRAYFFPGSFSTLYGYPIVDPPEHYTGVWTHYAYTGDPIAFLTFEDGDRLGKQVYLREDGTPYLVRYLNHQGWERDDLNLGTPPFRVMPWYFPQRWLNPTLARQYSEVKPFDTPSSDAVSGKTEHGARKEKATIQK
ncbi:MAG: hypothetical protein HY255_06030 [Betaproteobacteria bacterium]|nr:hypothetical protein [Betaproteobacteria bacterium]